MYSKQFILFSLLLSMIFLNTVNADDNRTRKFFAVQEMVSMVQKNEDIQFKIMLRRYFIEGLSYSATMLTVSPRHTFDIVQTNDGFKAFGHSGFWGTIGLYFPQLNTSVAVFILERDKRGLSPEIVIRIIGLLKH